MIAFKPVSTTVDMMARYEALFTACFASTPKFSLAALRWLYVDNPEGTAVGFDAWDGDVLAAHYVCIPTRIRAHGSEVRSLLSLNTATHPRYQGQGLFGKLAGLTFEAGAEAGFQSAYGVANANSSPAAVKKLGYRLVAPLQAMLGIGPMDIELASLQAASDFERVWTPATLRWRCANPVNPVAVEVRADRLVLRARAVAGWVDAQAELALPIGELSGSAGRPWTPFRLHLGLLPSGAGGLRCYANIPQRLRPSPLNLMYRPLVAGGSSLDPHGVHFNFLDFDAY